MNLMTGLYFGGAVGLVALHLYLRRDWYLTFKQSYPWELSLLSFFWTTWFIVIGIAHWGRG